MPFHIITKGHPMQSVQAKGMAVAAANSKGPGPADRVVLLLDHPAGYTISHELTTAADVDEFIAMVIACREQTWPSAKPL